MNHKTFKATDAHKLEDPERLRWMPPQEAVKLVGIVPGETIADIGAGTGFFAIPFARAVSPAGKVWAVDLQPEMIEILRQKLNRESDGLNVVPVHGSAASTLLLDSSCDAAFLGNVWHELDQRAEVLQELERILRPGGRLAILDWRVDTSFPPGPPLDHRVGVHETVATLERCGWCDVRSYQLGLYSYVVIAHSPRMARSRNPA